MATSRKAGRAKSKAAKSRPAKTAARKPAASSKKHVPSKSSRPAVKAVAKKMTKPAAKPAPKVVGKVVAKPGVKTPPVKPGMMKPAMKTPGKDGKAPAVAGKKGATAPAGPASKKAKRPVVPEVVRPLGVLPPESIARTRERPASRTTPHRPAPAAPARPQASSQGAQPLTEKDLKHFEERLLAERAKLMREMGHLENTVLKVNQRDSSGDLSGYSFHMADAGTDAYEREKAFLFASSEGRTLLEINEALRRLYGGTYGVCEMSGKPISRPRLEAIPWARYTLEVQEQLEKEERSRRSTP
jgi:RNA polymerase-binding transcription factor DksA